MLAGVLLFLLYTYLSSNILLVGAELSRTLLREGELQKLITEDRIAGVTSNPTIFYKAISESPYYRDELQALKADSSLSAEQRYETLAVADIRSACDLLQPIYKSSNGDDGYVSLEVSPVLAHDAKATVADGLQSESRCRSRQPADQGASHACRTDGDRGTCRPGLFGQRHADVFIAPCA